MLSSHSCAIVLACFVVVTSVATEIQAQDYDDEGYGNQPNGQDSDGYGGSSSNAAGYGADDGYASNSPNGNGYQQQGGQQDPDNVNSVQGGYSQSGSDPDADYEGDDTTAAASEPMAVRVKRSTAPDSHDVAKPISASLNTDASEPKMRVKRHSKHYIGPVYTYVKTDKHANFKWGVKHKVGKKHYG